ncbi:MAG TPA: glycogen/starch/alpha-glucan phosphorylase [Xanthobacteraceae bacterium]
METRTSLNPRQPALASDVRALRDAIVGKLTYALGTNPEMAAKQDWYTATALAVRDRVIDIWMRSSRHATQQRKKRVYYLSIEFLVGKALTDTLVNLGLLQQARDALASFDIDLDGLRSCEPDPGLGNGGLGRLAACYLDSMSALAIPAFGYGIRYQHGLFEQRFHDGWQEEFPDQWLAHGNPWEFPRPETTYPVHFGGTVEYTGGDKETAPAMWYPSETVLATAYDVAFAGWRGRHANTLRLWSARRTQPSQRGPLGDHSRSGTDAHTRPEAISDVLYPNDSTPEGQELRLRQEYFFTSASLQDLVQRHLSEHDTLDTLPDYAAIQLNDTHPAIAVAELMRILVDENDFSWKQAWTITRSTLSYTNHTLLPEALESWPVSLLGRLLPRHLQIIYLINWLHLQSADERGYTEPGFISRISLIDENADRRVRMGHLAFVGSHCVNGVSALHTRLLRQTVFGDLAKVSPTRIVNKTNGISFRRWLFEANEGLMALLREELGDRVLDNPESLARLEKKSSDAEFTGRYAAMRAHNKQRLAGLLRHLTGVAVEPTALFDVHIKRIHEYKRQLLNILEAIALWQAIRAEPDAPWPHRVKIFAGKAAGSYQRAKLIIKLAHDVARLVNQDPVVGNRLKIAFVPNYGVSLAECLVSAADLSEQISTAGMEASGTGNMKLALNGAITIGTLDGANIEIRDHVGAGNVVIFGLTAEEVEARRHERMRGRDLVGPILSGVIDSLESGELSQDDPVRYAPIVASLRDYDPFMVVADFDAYWTAQRHVDTLWQDPPAWWKSSIENTARMGWFSSDRSISEYAADIWRTPIPP